jgi:GTP-binding protein EngB required for normal cell division
MEGELIEKKKNHQQMMADVSHQVLQNIRSHYPPIVKDRASNMLKEFSIVMCGAPRIGKSTLINAIVGKNVAATSSGIEACTKKIQRYSMIDEKDTQFQIGIYDTPGLEEWNESITDVLNNTAPLVLVFCMAPHCWTPTDKLEVLLRQCFQVKILVALVCTNMWIGQKDHYKVILQTFDDLLTKLLHEQNYSFVKSEANGVTYFREVNDESDLEKCPQTMALYTAVNSEVHEHLDVNEQPSGVNELVDGITTSLDSTKVTVWFFAVLNNKGYWNQMRDDAFRAIKERVIMFGGGTIAAFKSFTTWFQ